MRVEQNQKMELTKTLNCRLRKSDKRELAWTRRTLTWSNEISWLNVTTKAKTLAEGVWLLRLKVHWKEWKYELGQLGVALSAGSALRSTYKGSPFNLGQKRNIRFLMVLQTTFHIIIKCYFKLNDFLHNKPINTVLFYIFHTKYTCRLFIIF